MEEEDVRQALAYAAAIAEDQLYQSCRGVNAVLADAGFQAER